MATTLPRCTHTLRRHAAPPRKCAAGDAWRACGPRHRSAATQPSGEGSDGGASVVLTGEPPHVRFQSDLCRRTGRRAPSRRYAANPTLGPSTRLMNAPINAAHEVIGDLAKPRDVAAVSTMEGLDSQLREQPVHQVREARECRVLDRRRPAEPRKIRCDHEAVPRARMHCVLQRLRPRAALRFASAVRYEILTAGSYPIGVGQGKS